jgi:hypothetical protein
MGLDERAEAAYPASIGVMQPELKHFEVRCMNHPLVKATIGTVRLNIPVETQRDVSDGELEVSLSGRLTRKTTQHP